MVAVVVPSKRHVYLYLSAFIRHSEVFGQSHVVDGYNEVAALVFEFRRFLLQTLHVVNILHLIGVDVRHEGIKPRLFGKAHEAKLKATLLHNEGFLEI